MNTRNTTLLSSALLAMVLTYSQPSHAEGLTGREFSTWSQSGQDGYISDAIVMAGFIAGQIDPAFSSCISRWYFEDPRGQAAKSESLRGIIARLSDHHPSATLLALIQEACGSFKR